MITSRISHKISVFQFIAMILVVYIHSYNIETQINGVKNNSISNFVIHFENFISFVICRPAVPAFFVISGFLFFLKLEKYNFGLYIIQLKKRFKTLVIPYLIWTFAWFFLILIAKNVFGLQHFFNTNESNVLKGLFINPINYQFWFLRDLIMLILLTPILYFFIKKTPYIFLAILFILINLFDKNIYVIFTQSSLFYFSLGAFFALNKINIDQKINFKLLTLLLLIWFILPIFKKSFTLFNVTLNLQELFIPAGLYLYWMALDFVVNKKHTHILLKLSTSSFFIYAFHEPILIGLKKITIKIFGFNSNILLLMYILLPIIVIIASILLNNFLAKYLPKVRNVLVGYR